MFEFLCMSLLEIAYVKACINEASEEKKEKEHIRDLKIKVFCYAIKHQLPYNQVVEMLQNKELTWEDIEK